MVIKFWVPGKPAQAGSKKAFLIKGKEKTFINTVDTNHANIKKWRPVVQYYCQIAMSGSNPFQGPVKLIAHFVRLRPKSHFTSKGELKKNAKAYPDVNPDTTKLVRSLEDALNKVAWRDDAQVVYQLATKTYGEKEGVFVKIQSLGTQGEISWE